MATFAEGGRITSAVVEGEITRLRAAWVTKRESGALAAVLPGEALSKLDLFDQLQLESILSICRASNTLAEAGRKLFAVSRKQRSVLNDTDRLKKYLARFNLDWHTIQHVVDS
jgi:transcriptional regulatory protein RtcR